MYWVFWSITQMSASVTSRIRFEVRFMIDAKIEVWFSRRKVEKAIAKISPRYFARSCVSILSATKFMVSSCLLQYRMKPGNQHDFAPDHSFKLLPTQFAVRWHNGRYRRTHRPARFCARSRMQRCVCGRQELLLDRALTSTSQHPQSLAQV